MQALVLEEKERVSLRDIPIPETLGPRDVRIAIRRVGICGSDVHYYKHGAIGPYVVREPMVLGHEAAGVVVEAGPEVAGLRIGDRVCMEPGIPNPASRAARLGVYNLDPEVRFWATPPIHGCLRPSVVHPADFTYKLPDGVGLDEGAMVEPLAVGMHAVRKARARPGDVAAVLGAGPIGILTALAALAGGCSRVLIGDVFAPKLARAAAYPGITPVNVREEDWVGAVRRLTDGWGADVAFEASGSSAALRQLVESVCPAGAVVLVGMPTGEAPLDVVAAQAKEVRIETVFRYAHVFPQAVALMHARKIDVRPLVTDRFPFSESIEAFRFAAHLPPGSVKVQIELPG